MADTNTANIGLLIADLNDVFNFGAHVEANFTTIDALMGAVQCTSGARPTNTYAGQIIYETDSKRYAQNTGTKVSPVWTYMSHAAFAAASSARPTTGLTAGMLLYETDNALVRSRGASAWNGLVPSAVNASPPANAIAGDVFYASDVDALVRYTGSGWRLSSTAGVTSGARPSTNRGAGSSIYETDTTRFLIWNGTTWEQKAFANFVCTSSTHPSSPFTGLEIFETDTGLNAVYNGSNYLYGLQQIATTQVLGSAAASVTFSSIPNVFSQLILYSYTRGDTASTEINVALQLNGDTGTNYQYQFAEFAPALSTGESYAQANLQIGKPPAASATAKYFWTGTTTIGGPTNGASAFVPIQSQGAGMFTGTTGGAKTGFYGGAYLSAAAVSSIKILPSSGNFVAGSRFALYGVM